MTHPRIGIGTLLHRVMAILLAACLLLPVDAATPEDDIRALYAAQGLLCAGDDGAHNPAESHCILCLVAACSDAASGFQAVAHAPYDADPAQGFRTLDQGRAAPATYHARAPPGLFA